MTWLEEPIYRKYAAKDSITKTLRGEVGLKKIELNWVRYSFKEIYHLKPSRLPNNISLNSVLAPRWISNSKNQSWMKDESMNQ